MPQSLRRVCLDVCTLCRPFDEQTQMRIRLETDAILLILGHLRERHLSLIMSPAHLAELGAIEEIERTQVRVLLEENSTSIHFDLTRARQRAEEFVQKGLGVADAAHLAFAEQAQADFVTCDDRLLRQCKRLRLEIWCGTPVAYCEKENLR